MTRRRLLVPAASLMLAPLLGGAATLLRSLPGRPAPRGTSATRCAQCGAVGHTMLDPRCPLAPRVLP